MTDKAGVSVFTLQTGTAYATLRERALRAEALGYEAYWVVDHFFASEGEKDVAFPEGWTIVAGLAEATRTIRLGVLVTCNAFRNPGLLAKSVTTADHISEGRIELGMGAGWMQAEYDAFGYRFEGIGARLAQLGESLAIVTSLMRERRTDFDGKYYKLVDAPLEPKPVQTPLPITLGGGGKRVFMKLVAKYAQRWNCSMPNAADLPAHLEALAQHCDAVGRDAGEVAISEQVAVVLGEDERDLAAKREAAEQAIGGFVSIDEMAICGTPDQVVDGMVARMKLGVGEFTVLFSDYGTDESMTLFAERVMPHLAL